MGKQLTVFVLMILFAVFAGCSKSSDTVTTSNEFSSKGKIVSIDAEKGSATIDHEKIDGLMSAMTMSFKAKDKKILDGVSSGDSVDFTLEKQGEDLVLSKLKTTAKAVANGADVFKQSCAKCHGDKGEGAKKGIPLIEGHALTHPKEDFVKQVSEGGKKMPAFNDKLSEEQIEAVVNYVRDEIQKGLRKDNGAGHKH